MNANLTTEDNDVNDAKPAEETTKQKYFRCPYKKKPKILTVHTYIRLRKNSLYKNLILISFSQCAMYTTYKMMMVIRQYEHDWLGIRSVYVTFISMIVAYSFLPALIIPCLKLKNTLCYGMVIYSAIVLIYYFGQMEAIIIVASIFLGPVAALVRVSQEIYSFRLARILCKVTGDDLETILIRFSGIFFAIYRMYDTLCYFPSTLVPRPPNLANHEDSDSQNYTCGSHFYLGDYESLTPLLLPPTNYHAFVSSIVILAAAYLIVLLMGLLFEPLHRLTGTNLAAEQKPRSCLNMFRLMKRREMLLIIPMTIFAGNERSFKLLDFSTAYVGCSKNSYHVIYITVLGSVIGSQSTLCLVPLVEVAGIQVLLGMAAAIHFILILYLLTWTKSESIAFYFTSATWALASSVWDCILYVLYGLLFPGEELEAYSHLGMWYAVGASTNMIISHFANTFAKLWVMLVFLSLTIVSIALLPLVKSTSNKISPVEEDIIINSSDLSPSPSKHDTETPETSKGQSVFLDKTAVNKLYHPSEVKTISTVKLHHVVILRSHDVAPEPATAPPIIDKTPNERHDSKIVKPSVLTV